MKRLRASNGGKMPGYTRREFGQITLAAAALPRARDGRQPSPADRVNLDIGHYARGGNDPFAYIKAHHERITHLHVRDMKRDGSPANIGEGDLQVAGILRTIRDSKWEVACILEQGRTGFDSSVAATRANLDYMRKVLES
jgi:sugar phosphate isomerase/epimerase